MYLSGDRCLPGSYRYEHIGPSDCKFILDPPCYCFIDYRGSISTTDPLLLRIYTRQSMAIGWYSREIDEKPS